MRTNRFMPLLAMLLLAPCLMVQVACDTNGDMGEELEDAGEEVEDAAEEAGDEIEDTAEDVEDEVEDAGGDSY